MKLIKILSLVIILFFVISCGSAPQSQDDSSSGIKDPIDTEEEPVLPEDLGDEELGEPVFSEPEEEQYSSEIEEEPEFVEYDIEEPKEEDDFADLPEPFIDMPEIVLPLISPAEDDESDLPEPVVEIAELIDETPELELLPEPPVVVQAAPVQPLPAPVQETRQPEPVRQEPPEPPSFLRQPEPVTPAPVYEAPSLPLNPLPELPARTPPVAQEEEIIFSRVVRATVGQLVEIPFRGTGWVYLGELSSRRGITYDSRRIDPEGQSFVFRTEAVGTYALKFYRQDFVRDYILNDHVQVIVGEAPESSGIGYFNPPVDRGRVIAQPRWPLIDGPESPNAQASQSAADSLPQTSQTTAIPPASSASPPQVGTPSASSAPVTQVAPDASSASPTSSTQSTMANNVPEAASSGTASPAAGSTGTVPPETSTAGSTVGGIQSAVPSLGLLPDEYLSRAKQEYDAGRVESALSILDSFKVDYPSGTDEAWWLYGQLLEANSPSRDIRLALEYYRRLVQEFPQSPRAAEAQSRIAYLERYYFNIR